MIIGEVKSSGLEKERINKRHSAAANKEMKCPASIYFVGEWFRVKYVGMGKLPTQQAQEPTANQSDIYATGNPDFSYISFGDVHEDGTDYAAEKRPG